jgi:hypothetical protein
MKNGVWKGFWMYITAALKWLCKWDAGVYMSSIFPWIII